MKYRQNLILCIFMASCIAPHGLEAARQATVMPVHSISLWGRLTGAVKSCLTYCKPFTKIAAASAIVGGLGYFAWKLIDKIAEHKASLRTEQINSLRVQLEQEARNNTAQLETIQLQLHVEQDRNRALQAELVTWQDKCTQSEEHAKKSLREVQNLSQQLRVLKEARENLCRQADAIAATLRPH